MDIPKKVVRASPKAIIAIGKILDEVCTKTVQGLARYAPSWDDDKVAGFIKDSGFPEIGPQHIRALRRQLVGNLNDMSGNTAAVKTPRMNRIEKDLTDVMNYLTSKNPNWRL